MMLVAFVHYCVLLDCESLTHVDFIPLFVIRVWHPGFPLNGIKGHLTAIIVIVMMMKKEFSFTLGGDQSQNILTMDYVFVVVVWSILYGSMGGGGCFVTMESSVVCIISQDSNKGK